LKQRADHALLVNGQKVVDVSTGLIASADSLASIDVNLSVRSSLDLKNARFLLRGGNEIKLSFEYPPVRASDTNGSDLNIRLPGTEPAHIIGTGSTLDLNGDGDPDVTLGQPAISLLTLSTGAGNDTVDLTKLTTLAIRKLPAALAMRVNLGAGNDTFRGSSAPEEVYGEAGADHLFGNGGDDWLVGDDGNDTIWGGPGRDGIAGANGNDLIHGGPGADMVGGGRGSDHVWGDAGNDIVGGGPDKDWLYGGTGSDEIYNDHTSEHVINCGPGDDLIKIVWPGSRSCERAEFKQNQ